MLTALFIAGSPIRSSEESPGAVVFMATFAIVSTIFSVGWSGSWQTKIIIIVNFFEATGRPDNSVEWPKQLLIQLGCREGRKENIFKFFYKVVKQFC